MSDAFGFGELRSLLSEPSREGFQDLCALLELMIEQEPARAREQWLPYALEALTAWPDAWRVCPESWFLALPERPEDIPMNLVRIIVLPRRETASFAQVDALRTHPDFGAIRYVVFPIGLSPQWESMLTLSPQAHPDLEVFRTQHIDRQLQYLASDAPEYRSHASSGAQERRLIQVLRARGEARSVWLSLQGSYALKRARHIIEHLQPECLSFQGQSNTGARYNLASFELGSVELPDSVIGIDLRKSGESARRLSRSLEWPLFPDDLRSLWLDDIEHGPGDLGRLFAHERLRKLETLTLEEVRLPRSIWGDLERASFHERLRNLSLSHTISHEPPTQGVMFPALRHLRVGCLGSWSEALSLVRRTPALDTLAIALPERVRYVDREFEALVRALEPLDLTSLSLDAAGPSFEGPADDGGGLLAHEVCALTQLSVVRGVRRLSLRGASIDGSGVDALLGLKGLELLDLRGALFSSFDLRARLRAQPLHVIEDPLHVQLDQGFYRTPVGEELRELRWAGAPFRLPDSHAWWP